MYYSMMLSNDDASNIKNFAYVLIGIFVLFVVWLVVRALVCWYYKIDERCVLLQRQNELLTEENRLLQKQCKTMDETLEYMRSQTGHMYDILNTLKESKQIDQPSSKEE